ncbi:MAG: hypothetical protein AB7K52_09415 [Phycisphaerales bacterium]
MSTAVAQARLKDALKELKLRYERVKQQWDDAARREFEERHLAPLESAVLGAMGAMGRIGEVCAAARRDCAPEG